MHFESFFTDAYGLSPDAIPVAATRQVIHWNGYSERIVSISPRRPGYRIIKMNLPVLVLSVLSVLLGVQVHSGRHAGFSAIPSMLSNPCENPKDADCRRLLPSLATKGPMLLSDVNCVPKSAGFCMLSIRRVIMTTDALQAKHTCRKQRGWQTMRRREWRRTHWLTLRWNLDRLTTQTISLWAFSKPSWIIADIPGLFWAVCKINKHRISMQHLELDSQTVSRYLTNSPILRHLRHV